MKNPKPLIDADGEVRELTQVDFARTKPAPEVLPTSLQNIIARRGRPVAEHPKTSVAIRLDQDVLAALKASGKGWQTRVNDALRALLVTK